MQLQGRTVILSSCPADRKSTRLNSSHLGISYAVFCLKKNKKKGAALCALLDHPGPSPAGVRLGRARGAVGEWEKGLCVSSCGPRFLFLCFFFFNDPGPPGNPPFPPPRPFRF